MTSWKMETFAVLSSKPSAGLRGLFIRVEIQWVVEGTERKVGVGLLLVLASLPVQWQEESGVL